MVILNVTKAIKYLPLSKDTSKNKGRYDIIYEIALNNKTTTDEIELNFGLYLAKIIFERVQTSIVTQTINGKPMSSIYPKLSQKYNNSKPLKARDKFWINTGKLLKQMRVWKSASGVNVGFAPNKKYSHGAKIGDVAVWLEKGTKFVPPRPLFTPQVVFISKNIDAYFKHFVMLSGYKI